MLTTPGVLRQPRRHEFRLVVDRAAVPHHRDRPQPPVQLGQEGHHLLGVNVVREEAEERVRPTRHRADGDGADGRQAVPSIPRGEHRRVPARGQCPSHRRREDEAGLVEEHQVRPAGERFADDPRELVPDPPRHLLVVPLAGLPPRLLAGPAEAVGEDLADVLGVVHAAEVAGDDDGHAVGGPQLVGPPVGLGPLHQQAFEPAAIDGRSTRVRLRGG